MEAVTNGITKHYRVSEIELYRLIATAVKTAVAEYRRAIAPAEDCISQREAYARYGEALVKEWVRKGVVQPYRNGSAKNSPLRYSIAELESALGVRNHMLSF